MSQSNDDMEMIAEIRIGLWVKRDSDPSTPKGTYSQRKREQRARSKARRAAEQGNEAQPDTAMAAAFENAKSARPEK